MIEVRALRSGDEGVFDHLAEGVFDHAVREEWVRAFLADPLHRIVVAIEDGVVVGFASGVGYLHPDKPVQFWINEVGTAPGHRRRGIGVRVMEGIVREARAMGCTMIWLGTEHENAAARGLYRKVGLRETEGLVMYEAVEG